MGYNILLVANSEIAPILLVANSEIAPILLVANSEIAPILLVANSEIAPTPKGVNMYEIIPIYVNTRVGKRCETFQPLVLLCEVFSSRSSQLSNLVN